MHLNIHPLTIFNANMTHVNVKLSGFERTELLANIDEGTGGATSSKSLSNATSMMPIEFMSPEAINHEQLSMSADVWSVGVFAALL